MRFQADDARSGRRLGYHRGAWWRHVLAVLAVLAYLAAGVGGAVSLWSGWQSARFERRGVAFGLPPRPLGVGLDPTGINVALEQYPDEQSLTRSLDLLESGGFRWLRQRFPWAEIEPARGDYRWERWDALVRCCQVRGLRIIAVLDTSPAWALAPEDAGNPLAPPRDENDLAAFARVLALRYGQAIDYYQVWDEPNICPHWGRQGPDPAGYLRLLRAVGAQIRDADADAILVVAGLAPTTETGDRNLSDLLFLRGLYAAGGRDAFDVVAAKAYGFWCGPEDRQVAPEILSFSRLVALREEMVRGGDGDKPLWAVAWGWCALPEGWQGRPSPWGDDLPSLQYERDMQAITRAGQEWPWLGLMCYAAWQPMAETDDPIWGLALLDETGSPSPLLQRFQALAAAPRVLYPGTHIIDGAPGSAGPVEIRFWGSRLDLEGPGRWQQIELDGRLLQDQGAARGRLATVARGLALGEHRLLLSASDPAAQLRAVVSREQSPWLPTWLVAAMAAGVIAATGALCWLLRPYPWQRWASTASRAYQGLSAWQALTVVAAGLALLVAAPGLALSLTSLAVLAVLIAGRPDAGLGMAVFLIPLAPLQKRFGPASFAYLEIATLLTMATVALGQLGAEAEALRRRPGSEGLWRYLLSKLRGLDALDGGWVLLIGASFMSLLVSRMRWMSLRELRVVVLQAAFIYWLVSRGRLGRAGILRLVDILVLSSLAISLQGLYQYGWTERVIAAEGVRRIRGIYGSPNNMALVLGRVLPLMLAMALAGPVGRRRLLYGLVAIPAGICLFLTFSRGAWLLGVPAALFVLGLLMGRRARLVALGLIGVALLGVLPFLGTVRLNSFLTGQGTTLLRVKLWEASWDMVRDHPILGVGLDNFLYQYPHYIRPEALSEPNLSHPHNVVLDFWLRLGLLGLCAFGWLVWQFYRRALRLWRRRTDPDLWPVVVGLLAGMTAMLAHGLIDAAFFVVELASLFALYLGLVRSMAVEPE